MSYPNRPADPTSTILHWRDGGIAHIRFNRPAALNALDVPMTVAFHAACAARADEQGYLFIVDRKKDMVVSGGFNVYPREVEDVLTTDTRVAMAAVIGVPDAKWGEAVMAVVVPRAGAVIDADSLVRLVKERKGAQHAPKHVVIVDALPLTALGKIDKKALRAPYWAGRDRGVA